MTPEPRLAETDDITEPDESAVPAAATSPEPSSARPTGPSAAPPVTATRERWSRIAVASRFPLAVYGMALVLHLAMLNVMNPRGGPRGIDLLLSWDGQWFTRIARSGYPDGFSVTPDGQITGEDLAFFPAYPLLTRAVHTVTGLGYDTAALVTAHLALIATLACVHQLVLRLYDLRTARFATLLLACAQPMAMVFFMAYSESLFLALAAGALLAVHRKAWLTAGVLTLFAGLTRPVAVAVVAALTVAVVLHVRRERRLSWRPVAALVLACCGTPAYLLWVGLRTGHLDGWFTIQEAGWGTHWDNGRSFADFLGQTLTRGDGWVPVSTALLLLALIVATVVAWLDEVWPPLLAYGTLVLIIALGQSNYYHSKLRLLLPALVFLIPAARALARAHTRTAVITLGAASLFGLWYGAYMLTTWSYAI